MSRIWALCLVLWAALRPSFLTSILNGSDLDLCILGDLGRAQIFNIKTCVFYKWNVSGLDIQALGLEWDRLWEASALPDRACGTLPCESYYFLSSSLFIHLGHIWQPNFRNPSSILRKAVKNPRLAIINLRGFWQVKVHYFLMELETKEYEKWKGLGITVEIHILQSKVSLPFIFSPYIFYLWPRISSPFTHSVFNNLQPTHTHAHRRILGLLRKYTTSKCTPKRLSYEY